MGKYKAILFDMDGTLLPMDMNAFTKGYFKFLYAKLTGNGHKLDPETFPRFMWAGVEAMVRGDGSVTNEVSFWNRFCELTDVDVEAMNADCLDFYGNEFHQAKAFTGENPLAREAVMVAHEKADIVALATNPLFPMVAQVSRMSWIGLEPADFALVSSMESDHFCKPNPNYYIDFCSRLGVEPSDCLMIGNDEREDMYTASKLGMDCYLVTDCVIPCEEHPWDGPKGTFAELVEMLRGLE